MRMRQHSNPGVFDFNIAYGFYTVSTSRYWRDVKECFMSSRKNTLGHVDERSELAPVFWIDTIVELPFVMSANCNFS